MTNVGKVFCVKANAMLAAAHTIPTEILLERECNIYILDMNERGFYLILVGKTSFGRIMIIDIRLA